MRLHRLTGLEQDKLTDEYKQLLETIRGLIEILENPDVLLEVIRTELRNLKEEFGDARRSEIRASEEDLDILDLIAPEDVVVTLSHAGYAKRQPASAYRAQKRGGKGRNAAATKEEDFIDQLWLVNTHDTLLTFTSAGRVFWLSVYQLPDAGPNARGRPIINWIPLEAGEKVQAVLPVREYERRPVRVLRHPQRHGQEDAADRVRVPPAARQDRDQPRRGRCAGRRAADQRRARHHAVRQQRQGRALRRERSALDGPHRHRRARHPPGRGRAGAQPDRGRRRRRHPHRQRARLRQAHPGRANIRARAAAPRA